MTDLIPYLALAGWTLICLLTGAWLIHRGQRHAPPLGPLGGWATPDAGDEPILTKPDKERMHL